MSWPKIRWNNRIRLAWITTWTVSLCLAIAFGLLSMSIRVQALHRRTAEVNAMLKRIGSEWLEGTSLAEQSDDFPGLSISIFSPDGRLKTFFGRHAPGFANRTGVHNDYLSTSVEVKGLVSAGSISIHETEVGLQQLNFVLIGLWVPLCLFTGLITWYGGGIVLKPVKKLVYSASRLSGLQNGERLETQDRAEFQDLTVALNGLLDRVEKSGRLQEQFASDAAHELRTPLTLLRTQIETTLLRQRDASDYQGALKAMLGEVERLTAIVETLLASARSAGGASVPVDLSVEVANSVKSWLAGHPEWAAKIDVQLAGLSTRIPPQELDIVLHNLLDNAARFANEGSHLQVKVSSEAGEAVMIVANEGPQMSKDQQELAFERLYRGDEARNRATGGAGIGLSLVRKIVESKGGRVQFCDEAPLTIVKVSLPLLVPG